MSTSVRLRAGFSIVEVIVLLVIAAVFVGIMLPSQCRAREVANRTICSSNLAGIYKALYTYSTTSRDKFPVAGTATPGGEAIGFREGDRRTGVGAVLYDNVTATLWILVRDGSTGSKSYVCPSSINDTHDPGTLTPYDDTPAMLENTYDFLRYNNLSYSIINMYHPAGDRQWDADVNPAWVLMGDNNANENPDRHRSSKSAPAADVEQMENSPNHGYEGQNLLFGDSHVSYVNDPYQGPSDDNVYAMTEAGRDVPPRLAHDAGDAATDNNVMKTDVALLPVSGNGGFSLSGMPMDIVSAADVESRNRQQGQMMLMAVPAVIVMCILIYVLSRARSDQPAE